MEHVEVLCVCVCVYVIEQMNELIIAMPDSGASTYEMSYTIFTNIVAIRGTHSSCEIAVTVMTIPFVNDLQKSCIIIKIKLI